MKNSDISFDKNLRMLTSIKDQVKEVALVLSDSLEAVDEELKPNYLEKIRSFLDDSNVWYRLAVDRIKLELTSGSLNGVEAYDENSFYDEKQLRLINIYILSEQDEERMVFGLEFRVAFDIEHGRGMKIYKDNHEIFDYGLGEEAFS